MVNTIPCLRYNDKVCCLCKHTHYQELLLLFRFDHSLGTQQRHRQLSNTKQAYQHAKADPIFLTSHHPILSKMKVFI